MLFGKFEERGPDELDFSAQDHATLRTVWSLFLDDASPSKLRQATRLLDQDPHVSEYVCSISPDTHVPNCPKHWHHALKDPVYRGQWIEAMYKHLDSCYALGTYGCPSIPPKGATVLPAVIVLKLVVNALKQIDNHKVRICVHGGHQVQGRDYDESYAHTILAQSLKTCVAVGCYLGWQFFHFDVHNAFQSTPDTGDEHGQPTWLRVNAQWLEYIKEKKPDWWPAVQLSLQGRRPEDLAVPMNAYVQGRVDASRKWSILIEKRIFTDLKLTPNRADPSVYSGHFQGSPLIMCRATDDFLVICEFRSTYDAIVAIFKAQWTIHALGSVTTFFGINFHVSSQCVTLDQNDKVASMLSSVYGTNWSSTPPKASYSSPMIAGTAHAEDLARCSPYSADELQMAQTSTFGFGFRTILCGSMHIALWTRLDILPACIFLAQYQSAPGVAHFQAVKRLTGYLRLHPDVPLAFSRRRTPAVLQSLSLSHSDLSPKTLLIEIMSADPTQAISFEPLSYCVMSVDQDPSLQPLADSSTNVILARAPFTEAHADSNLPGGIFERLAQAGASIEIGGTTVITICKKQDTMADNSTVAEIGAANLTIKSIRWLRLFMADIGLPFDGPIPVAEDNAATRIIAHAGKTTKNVRHVAIQTLNLQQAVRNQMIYFRQIETAENRSDHFTKALPATALRKHCVYMMGLRFITDEHAALVKKSKYQAKK
jgi:hypothetical protein